MTTHNDQHPAGTPGGIRAGIQNLKSNVTKAADAGKVLTRLAPKQLKDEIQIAKIEVKEKGIALGKGVAVAVGALVFALFMAIALVILAYVGLSKVLEPWAAALILAGIFLLLATLLGFVGYRMIKKQLPLKPESALFGVLYDLGVLKEGSAMTSTRLKSQQAEKAAAAQQARAEAAEAQKKDEAPKVPAPNKEQLIQRTAQRREHLKSLRDDIQNYANDVQAGAKGLVGNAKTSAQNAPANALAGGKKLASNASNPETLQAHWKSFAALAASIGAFFLFLGKLIRRGK